MIVELETRIVHNGRDFRVKLYLDETHGYPWNEEDGHGPVRQTTQRHVHGESDKLPGERPLNQAGRREYQFHYDWQGAVLTARRDKWGLDPQMIATMTEGLGRAPRRREVAAMAVEQDYQRMRAYLRGDWRYVGVNVTDDQTGKDEEVWGVESDGNFWREVAIEIADGMFPLAEAHEAAGIDCFTD